MDGAKYRMFMVIKITLYKYVGIMLLKSIYTHKHHRHTLTRRLLAGTCGVVESLFLVYFIIKKKKMRYTYAACIHVHVHM